MKWGFQAKIVRWLYIPKEKDNSVLSVDDRGKNCLIPYCHIPLSSVSSEQRGENLPQVSFSLVPVLT
jgi:hypothetical protein